MPTSAPPLLFALIAIHVIASFFFSDALAAPPENTGVNTQASAQGLEKDVRSIVEFGARDSEHPENLLRVASYIAARFRDTGFTPELQRFQVGGATYMNVSAFTGIDPAIRSATNSDGRVVVGAHYDAAGPFPGADDNASGVAGLLELARLLRESPPKLPVELVAYTLEEPPHFAKPTMGSVHHAQGLRDAGSSVRLMLSLEMIGYFTDEPNSQKFPIPQLSSRYPTVGNFIAVVGSPGHDAEANKVSKAMIAGSPLPVFSIIAPKSLAGIDFSDHRSYVALGFPALMITDTAMYRNRAYHTAADTPDRLDYKRMGQVVDAIKNAVLSLQE